jgi:hypothetical protein
LIYQAGGLGDNRTYEDGDTVKLYPATTESIEAMRNPRTPKGSVVVILKAIGGPPPVKKKKSSKPKETGFRNYAIAANPRYKTRRLFQINWIPEKWSG